MRCAGLMFRTGELLERSRSDDLSGNEYSKRRLGLSQNWNDRGASGSIVLEPDDAKTYRRKDGNL
jgi:hypothetical protein